MEIQRKFQFHNGSIKGESQCSVRYAKLCFNSTMVRLKVMDAGLARGIIKQFQFHNGSIKGLIQ